MWKNLNLDTVKIEHLVDTVVIALFNKGYECKTTAGAKGYTILVKNAVGLEVVRISLGLNPLDSLGWEMSQNYEAALQWRESDEQWDKELAETDHIVFDALNRLDVSLTVGSSVRRRETERTETKLKRGPNDGTLKAVEDVLSLVIDKGEGWQIALGITGTSTKTVKKYALTVLENLQDQQKAQRWREWLKANKPWDI